MSSVFWRTKKQQEQFNVGQTLTQKIEEYKKTWCNRCYGEDIPDDVPNKIMDSKRAPSYKAIAIAILKNDHNLYSLGFSQRESQILSAIIEQNKEKEQLALDL